MGNYQGNARMPKRSMSCRMLSEKSSWNMKRNVSCRVPSKEAGEAAMFDRRSCRKDADMSMG